MTTEIQVYDKISEMSSIQALGQAIAKSGMFGCENESQGTILALQCITERKPPLELSKTYHIIKGKLSKKADAMLAEFRKAGGKWRWHDLKNREVQTASIEWEEQKMDVSYSIDDSKLAGWWTEKDRSGNPTNWIKIPANMLRARLISETLRAIAPEIVQGAYTPEEIYNFDEPKDSPKPPKPVIEIPKPPPSRSIPDLAKAISGDDDELEGDHPRDRLQAKFKGHEDLINDFLRSRQRIQPEQNWRDAPKDLLLKIEADVPAFLTAVGVE